MLVKEAIHAARTALASAGCTEAEEESRLMLCGLLGTGLPALRSRYEDPYFARRDAMLTLNAELEALTAEARTLEGQIAGNVRALFGATK